MLGQVCFNFVGKLGGWSYIPLEDVTDAESLEKSRQGKNRLLQSNWNNEGKFEQGQGLTGYMGVFAFGRVIFITGLCVVFKLLGSMPVDEDIGDALKDHSTIQKGLRGVGNVENAWNSGQTNPNEKYNLKSPGKDRAPQYEDQGIVDLEFDDDDEPQTSGRDKAIMNRNKRELKAKKKGIELQLSKPVEKETAKEVEEIENPFREFEVEGEEQFEEEIQSPHYTEEF